MKSGTGSQELTRQATAYFASIAFGVTFLVASLAGVDGGTALGRSVTAAVIAMIVGWLLAAPVVGVLISAAARDEAERQAAAKAKEDDA